MPYKLKKVGSGWKVCKKVGNKCFSKEPMPKSRAQAQMSAIHANESFDQACERILQEYNNIGATTTSTYTAPITNSTGQQANPNNPTDAKNVCLGKDANNPQHVQDVVSKLRSHPEWQNIKQQYKTADDTQAAKQLISDNNPATPQPNQQNTPALNKPNPAGVKAPASAPSTAPSVNTPGTVQSI